MSLNPDATFSTPESALVEQEAGAACPACGYDLRATTSDRCSECGVVVDRQALKHSSIPFALHPGFFSYWKTVWLITIDSAILRFEGVKPQPYAAARWFRRISGAFLALSLLTVFTILMRSKGWELFAFTQNFIAIFPRREPPWRIEVILPWSTAATMWPVLPILLVVLSLFLTDNQRVLRSSSPANSSRTGRGAAMACYASAPLALLIVPSLIAVATIWRPFWYQRHLPWWVNPLLDFWLAGAAIFALLTFIRMAQWAMRLEHRGLAWGLATAGYLLVRWLVMAVLVLGILPWCLGFFWLVIDSFR